ncbi:hypothetical protein H9L13_06405 [Sphingomonas lutea]|uniref:Uncharacterized protein n=1 Tax=Sphingomonas lutea TaxID=1045317 RepID=A0A7G9SET9_9SPHN|nr:hypothetical protein [Sphingomonas lutea]QNN66364.1 hypothetical protein H9L13_06405 [Sphingomonas lutea]
MFDIKLSHTTAGWYESKLFIEHALAISHDGLHVVIGVLIQLIAASLLRRTVASWLPWAAVLAFALANEVVDLRVERWPSPGMQFGEGAKDIVLTILLPTILLAVTRLRPALFGTRLDSPAERLAASRESAMMDRPYTPSP